MDQEESLKNEQIEKVLSPHPLSFMMLQSLSLFLMIWGILVGWIVNFSDMASLFTANEWLPVLVWGVVLLVGGVVAALLTIRWSIFFMYLFVFAFGVLVLYTQGWLADSAVFIPFYSIGAAIFGFLLVEVHRRSHKYIITNLRIIFKGGFITKRERTLPYDKITDLHSEQGILGQIFGFGTIIPISASGFGLGSDQSFAAGGVEVGGKKIGFLGLAGGGKEVQTPRSRSYFELHGIHPYKECKSLVEKMFQSSVISPYQQEQVKFQKQQVDIQEQMRDLLKKQIDTENEKSEE
jgi:membrane protein YdbS with pleckstrin-like domain